MAKYGMTNFSAAASRDFAEKNAERAMQITNYSLNWMREIAEQNLLQSRAIFESLLTLTQDAVNETDQQICEFLERSVSLTEKTLEFARKLVRAKEPEELAHLQNEFVSEQTQALVDNAAEFGQNMMREADEVAKSARAAESLRRRSEAA